MPDLKTEHVRYIQTTKIHNSNPTGEFLLFFTKPELSGHYIMETDTTLSTPEDSRVVRKTQPKNTENQHGRGKKQRSQKKV